MQATDCACSDSSATEDRSLSPEEEGKACHFESTAAAHACLLPLQCNALQCHAALGAMQATASAFSDSSVTVDRSLCPAEEEIGESGHFEGTAADHGGLLPLQCNAPMATQLMAQCKPLPLRSLTARRQWIALFVQNKKRGSLVTSRALQPSTEVCCLCNAMQCASGSLSLSLSFCLSLCLDKNCRRVTLSSLQPRPQTESTVPINCDVINATEAGHGTHACNRPRRPARCLVMGRPQLLHWGAGQ